MVDSDSQCNLTGMSLPLSGSNDFESFYWEKQDGRVGMEGGRKEDT